MLVAILAAIGLLGLGVFTFLHMPQIESGVETRLQTHAERALAAGGADWARVGMEGQVAQIAGTAPSDDAAADAAERVARAAGAGGPVFGGVTRVETDIEVSAPISPFVFRAVRTDDGRIILEGHVSSEADRSGVVATAEGFEQAGVIDRLAVGPGAPDEGFGPLAAEAVGHLGRLETGRAEITDTLFILRGITMVQADRAEISAAVANVKPPYRGEPELRGPGHWFARHIAEGLLLSGRVNSEADQAELMEIAETHYDGQVIDDMQVAADGPQGWTDGVRRGLPHFSRFRSGRMTFAPDEGGFTFEGEAAGSTLAYLAEDMAGYEGEFGVQLAAEEVAIEVEEIADIDFDADPRGACEAAFASVLDGNAVNFASGKADITRDSGATLDKLMAVSSRCAPGLIFEIGGHTDSAGDPAFNTYLSEQRAQAVADYMTARGFPGDRLVAVGYGPDQPLADNRTAEGRAANRRIEFKVLERSE